MRAIFDECTREATELTATTEFAAPPGAVQIDTQDLIQARRGGLSLPVKIKLGNPLLGARCYIARTPTPS